MPLEHFKSVVGSPAHTERQQEGREQRRRHGGRYRGNLKVRTQWLPIKEKGRVKYTHLLAHLCLMLQATGVIPTTGGLPAKNDTLVAAWLILGVHDPKLQHTVYSMMTAELPTRVMHFWQNLIISFYAEISSKWVMLMVVNIKEMVDAGAILNDFERVCHNCCPNLFGCLIKESTALQCYWWNLTNSWTVDWSFASIPC